MTTSEKSTEVAQRVEFIAPRTNLHQDAGDYVLEVEMPGVTKEGIEVTVEDGKLTLIGHRAAAASGAKVIYSERPYAEYRRVFDLDPSIDPEKITASVEQGLLTLRLQKAETAKPRKIAIV